MVVWTGYVYVPPPPPSPPGDNDDGEDEEEDEDTLEVSSSRFSSGFLFDGDVHGGEEGEEGANCTLFVFRSAWFVQDIDDDE